MCVCLSVLVQQLVTHQKDFHENWKYVEKIQFSLKSDKNKE